MKTTLKTIVSYNQLHRYQSSVKNYLFVLWPLIPKVLRNTMITKNSTGDSLVLCKVKICFKLVIFYELIMKSLKTVFQRYHTNIANLKLQIIKNILFKGVVTAGNTFWDSHNTFLQFTIGTKIVQIYPDCQCTKHLILFYLKKLQPLRKLSFLAVFATDSCILTCHILFFTNIFTHYDIFSFI